MKDLRRFQRLMKGGGISKASRGKGEGGFEGCENEDEGSFEDENEGEDDRHLLFWGYVFIFYFNLTLDSDGRDFDGIYRNQMSGL